MRPGHIRQHLEEAVLLSRHGRALERAPAPLVIGATGGSGTRLVTMIARYAGLFMGVDVNEALDSEPMGHFIRSWTPTWLSAGAAGLPPGARAEMDRALRVAAIRHRRGISSPSAPWGSKNPRSIYLLEYFEQQLPGLRFLHLVRHGLDMAFSDNQLQLEAYGDWLLPGDERSVPERSIAIWNRVNLEASDFGSDRMGARYLCIRFEDLCDEPGRVVRRIFDFLDVSNADKLAAATAEVRPPSTIGRRHGRDPALLERLIDEAGAALRRFDYLKAFRA